MSAVSAMEANGTPIDIELLSRLVKNWEMRDRVFRDQRLAPLK
jgi:hypothetical protein